IFPRIQNRNQPACDKSAICNLKSSITDVFSDSTFFPWCCRTGGASTRASCATHACAPHSISHPLLRSAGPSTHHSPAHNSEFTAANNPLFGNSLYCCCLCPSFL